jgi:hypothetical protein
MWKVMIKDISKSQKLDRELSPLELTSLIQDDEISPQCNSMTHMCLGKHSNPTVTGCQGNQAKVEKNPRSSIEVDIRIVGFAVLLSSIGVLTIIMLTLQLIQSFAECLVMMIISIVRFVFFLLT